MGVKINITGTEISGRVLNNAVINAKEDVDIGLHNTQILENAIVLDNLKIDTVLNELSEKAKEMNQDTEEYLNIQRILEVQRWDTKTFAKCIAAHLSNFSQGVLASVFANYLTMK